MEITFAQAIAGINWIWYAIAVVGAFLIGALWYSLIWYNMWIRVFRLKQAAVAEPGSMIRSFVIQCVTGAMVGLLTFILTDMAVWFGILGILTIAGWQMCAITFKYSGYKEFLEATLIESGYTVVCGIVYIPLALL